MVASPSETVFGFFAQVVPNLAYTLTWKKREECLSPADGTINTVDQPTELRTPCLPVCSRVVRSWERKGSFFSSSK